jgi:hypothetical protein
MSGHKDSVKKTTRSASAPCSSPLPPISISSHRTHPLEVEVTRATRRRRTPPPPPLSPTTAPRRRHFTHHRHTPNHNQGWVIGILSLFLSYLWMMSTSATKTRFILDIAKTFLILWILLDGGYGLGKFLDLVYRINLRASGVSCMKPIMIGG